MYLDGGLEAARAFLLRELDGSIAAGASQAVVGHDYKSALQERLQASGRPLPEYIVTGEEGPDHQKAFKVDVVVAGQVLGRASGRAKKQAEQEAARLGLEALDRAQSSSESAGGSSAPGESGR